MRIVGVLILILSGFIAQGQNRQSFYLTGNAGLPSGSYRSYLGETENNGAKIGFSAGFLLNPRKNFDYSFPISLGGEFGLQGLGRDPVPSGVGGSFNTAHNALWLNFVGRYRPVLETNKLKPFIEVQIGPKLHYSRIFEQISSEETIKVDGFSSWSKNYGIGGGFDFKLNPKNTSKTHLEVALYYFYGEKTKRMLRNSALIDVDGFSDYALVLESSQQWQIRLGIIGLDSSL